MLFTIFLVGHYEKLLYDNDLMQLLLVRRFTVSPFFSVACLSHLTPTP